ncbi:acyl transferase/acyl hydrolase/lysophospholipase [Pelagophyceae sp. CCMP2097]|nr:acyl transferase/acyl hydrolase/lysophospholipase [Pelagophyceae sp. CCMP2097]
METSIRCIFDVVFTWGATLLKLKYAASTTLIALTLVFSPMLFFRVPLGLLWTAFSALLAVVQGCYVCYQLFMILASLVLLTLLLALRRTYGVLLRLTQQAPRWQQIQAILAKAATWGEYEALAVEHAGSAAWVGTASDMASAPLLHRAIADLRAAPRDAESKLRDLRFTLSGLTKRDHLGIESAEWYPPTSPTETKRLIDDYLAEVQSSLAEVADSDHVPDEDKARFFHQVRRTVGVTALCLSGGGATTMYHGGHILGLIEAGVFEQIRVVSGTSGGSIMAAMMGCKTRDELLRDVLVETVSTDYGRDGVQRRDELRFFPPLWKQMLYFSRRRVLVDSGNFKKTCDYYWGTITFQEAFEHTRKVLCISVSAQRVGSDDSSQRLLMNHITTPHVTLSSAVAASCALPGIQRPQRLEAKDSTGRVVPFEVDGVSWIDGSIQADVPFKRMATLFNVSNFIVAQVNFHVKLVVEDSASPYSPYQRTTAEVSSRTAEGVPPRAWAAYRRLVRAAELSMRMRATMLSQLGLMPSLYGNNLQKVFSQKYHGNVTISPRFTYMQTIGLSAICNPTESDMKLYLDGGKRAVWPHICRIRRMLLLEATLSDCWTRVRQKRFSASPGGKVSSLPDLRAVGLHDTHEHESDEHEWHADPAEATPGSPPLPPAGPPRRQRSITFADQDKQTSDLEQAGRHYRQLEWEYRRLMTQMERLRSDNLDLKRRLDDIRQLSFVK